MAEAPTNYPATLLAGTVITIAGPGGAPASFTLLDLLSLKLPGRKNKRATWIPQSGAKAGLEQALVGSQQAGEVVAQVLYSRTARTTMETFTGVNGCTITITMPKLAGQTTADVFAGTGGLVSTQPKQVADTEQFEDTLTFAVNGGWTWTTGT
jgi:hypothetical protein